MAFILANIFFYLLIDFSTWYTIKKKKLFTGGPAIFIAKISHITLSLLSWIYLLLIILYRGDFADNLNISRMFTTALLISVVWIPRVIILVFVWAAHFIRSRNTFIEALLKYTGYVLAGIVCITVMAGYLGGRFNFRYKEVQIFYDDLPARLDGFTIAHISDLHLSSFYRHEDKLESVAARINSYEPDIIVNTGDFVTIAWNEMPGFCNILSAMQSRYGNFAVPGNHDTGIYHPSYNENDRIINVIKMDSLIAEAGYMLLKDSSLTINIDSTSLRIAGITTHGSIPDISYGDIDKALGDSAGLFTILLSHDPNYWYKNPSDRRKADLTLSGHTHGMQLGIDFGNIHWSPARRLYPAWDGLYGEGGNYLYVNRGLGTISLPIRIGMPPEVTMITLKKPQNLR